MKAEVFGFTTHRNVKGRRKIGLDSNVIVDLVNKPENLELLKNVIKNLSPYLNTHSRCIEEAKNVLVRDYGFKEKKAIKEVDSFIKNFKINIIKGSKANSKYAWKILKDCNKHGIDLHPPDNFIIADLKKADVKQIYSQDDVFVEACEFLGMEAGRLIEKESDDLDKIRRFFKQNKKKY